MLKKIVIGIVLVVVVLAGLSALSHQYRQEFFAWAIEAETKKAGLQEKRGQLDGHQFFYFEGGNLSAPTLVLLHGFTANKESWLRFAGHLTADYHIIALDLAGHGKSDAELVPSFSVAEQAKLVGRITEKLGLQKFAVVGNSMGGAIASLTAAMFPERVTHVVLISPAGVHTVPAEFDAVLAKGQNPLIAKTPEQFSDVIEFVMAQPPFIPSAIKFVQGEKAAARAALNEKIFADIQHNRKVGFHNEIAQVKAPTLIMWGALDRAIHVDNLKGYVALIPHAKSHVFENIGHLAMIEVPEESARLTREFLQAKP